MPLLHAAVACGAAGQSSFVAHEGPPPVAPVPDAVAPDDPPAPGEWVLIHVGFALSKIDEQEAAAALEFLEGIGQAYEDELTALKASVIE